MGPQDHLRALLDGLSCTVCEERVPADHLRLLARRDDLLFLEVACEACGSTALSFIANEAPRPEPGRRIGTAPVSTDDVLDMHELLDRWTGDLASLVGRTGTRRDRHLAPDPVRSGRHA